MKAIILIAFFCILSYNRFMNILLTNDDGFESDGIRQFAQLLSEKHNVVLIAPENNRSAVSHSLSIFKNIVVKKVSGGKFDVYSVSGTPADCVKFAHHELSEKFPIDLVVAGINRGHNLGTDILYSGTVSAAFEGAALGYKAMAFSYVEHSGGDMRSCALIACNLLDKLYPLTTSDYIWNINIPSLINGTISGVKITPLGKQIYSDNFKKVSEDTYILVGEMLVHDENDENCDVELSRKGYVTVTPLLYDKTAFSVLKRFEKLEL